MFLLLTNVAILKKAIKRVFFFVAVKICFTRKDVPVKSWYKVQRIFLFFFSFSIVLVSFMFCSSSVHYIKFRTLNSLAPRNTVGLYRSDTLRFLKHGSGHAMFKCLGWPCPAAFMFCFRDTNRDTFGLLAPRDT